MPPGQGVTLTDWFNFIHSDDLPIAMAVWRKGLELGHPSEVERRVWDVLRQEHRWHLARAIPLRDSTGIVVQWLHTSTDIHQRKLAEIHLAASEQALRRREQQLALLFESGIAGDWTLNLKTDEMTAHPTSWAIYGKIVDKRTTGPAPWFRSRWHPSDAEETLQSLRSAIAAGTPFHREFRLLLPDGTVRWVEKRAVVLRDSCHNPLEMHGLHFEITERRAAEFRIHQSEKHFRELAGAMPQIVWYSTPTGTVDYCNARFIEYTGFTVADMQANRWDLNDPPLTIFPFASRWARNLLPPVSHGNLNIE